MANSARGNRRPAFKVLLRDVVLKVSEKRHDVSMLVLSRLHIKAIGSRRVLPLGFSNGSISQAISAGEPFLVSRLGETETNAINAFYANGGGGPVASAILSALDTLSGVFPIDELSFGEFCNTYVGALKEVDLLAVRDTLNNSKESRLAEARAVHDFARSQSLITWSALFPVRARHPWTQALAGKTVLVIHPFATEIMKQHKRINEVYPNGFLPDFRLVVVSPPQLLANSIEREAWESWHEALEATKREIKNTSFDVALIAAGAMGLPLGAYCKGLGKPAVHVGGELQLFFGITGRRWEVVESLPRGVQNSAWIRPSAALQPLGYKRVEKGAYW